VCRRRSPLIVRLGHIEGGAHLGRRHRQLGQAAVDRAVDRVGDRRHRRHVNAIEAREPSMSGLPVAMMTAPSPLTCALALDSPPPLNQ
jgi:hypothetical protein